MKKLLANRWQTPDGTILWSKHRHDYVEHWDKNGEYYAIDGGASTDSAYTRKSINEKEMKNLCPVKWVVDSEKRKRVEKEYNELLLNFLTFETICDDWNRIVKKEDSFEKFLIFVKDYDFEK